MNLKQDWGNLLFTALRQSKSCRIEIFIASLWRRREIRKIFFVNLKTNISFNICFYVSKDTVPLFTWKFKEFIYCDWIRIQITNKKNRTSCIWKLHWMGKLIWSNNIRKVLHFAELFSLYESCQVLLSYCFLRPLHTLR